MLTHVGLRAGDGPRQRRTNWPQCRMQVRGNFGKGMMWGFLPRPDQLKSGVPPSDFQSSIQPEWFGCQGFNPCPSMHEWESGIRVSRQRTGCPESVKLFWGVLFVAPIVRRGNCLFPPPPHRQEIKTVLATPFAYPTPSGAGASWEEGLPEY